MALPGSGMVGFLCGEEAEAIAPGGERVERATAHDAAARGPDCGALGLRPAEPIRQSRPRAWKLTEPVGVTTTWSSSVTSIVLSASRMRPVMSMSALDGSGSVEG